MRTVIVPSTLAWTFASLTPSISFALIGVVVGEFIGGESGGGLGYLIIQSLGTLNAADMMVAGAAATRGDPVLILVYLVRSLLCTVVNEFIGAVDRRRRGAQAPADVTAPRIGRRPTRRAVVSSGRRVP